MQILTIPCVYLLISSPTGLFENIKSFQDSEIKNKPSAVLVLGKKDLLDIKTLEKFGTIKYLTLKEIFGY